MTHELVSLPLFAWVALLSRRHTYQCLEGTMRLYVAGPMRGIPEWNWPMFDAATAWLRSLGYEVINPAEHDREIGLDQHPGYTNGDAIPNTEPIFQNLIGWDLEQIARPGWIDGLALLPGWENSSGTAMELKIARWTGKRVGYLHPEPGWSLIWEQPPLIVGLSGYAQVGKDTLATGLVKAGFTRLALADPLREMIYRLNPLVDGTVPGRRASGPPLALADLIDHYGWEGAKKLAGSGDFGVRSYLQRLGTEGGRDVLGEDVWINAAMSRIKHSREYVIPDVRFPNEAKAIKDAGGEVWRVVRRNRGPTNNHPSETAMDDWAFDRHIYNVGTVESLIEHGAEIGRRLLLRRQLGLTDHEVG